MTTPNDAMADAIRRRLHDDDTVEEGDITVSVHDGTATLSGHATDRRAIDAALKAARAVDGVVEVVNALELDKSIYGTLARSRDKQREVLDDLADDGDDGD